MPSYKPYPYALIRGSIVPTSGAQVSVMTNSLHYGVGIFGGIKAYHTPKGIGIFRLDDHLRRLAQSCEFLDFPYAFDKTAVKKVILDLAGKNNIADKTYIRPLLYRSDTNLAPDIDGQYDLAIYMLDMSAGYLVSAKGQAVVISSWIRNNSKAIPPRTKATGGYLNSALAIHEAKQNGYDSAIMLNDRGEVCEGAVMNLFIVKDGQLITPDLDADILEGITRRTIIKLAREFKLSVSERPVQKAELFNADELFFCGTATEIAWCQSVDGREISTKIGPLTKKLTTAFHSLPSTHPHLFTII